MNCDNKKSPLDVGASKGQEEISEQAISSFVLYNNIPQELKLYSNWLVYKLVPRDNGKMSKVPYSPLTGSKGNMVGVCGTYEQAIALLKQGYDGLGFHFDNTPYTGIDLDNHVANGELDEMAMEIFLLLEGAYCEYSPSGNGLHFIVKGETPNSVKNDKKGFEMYSQGRFFTMTGDKLPSWSSNIAQADKQLKTLYEIYKTTETNYRNEEIQLDCTLPAEGIDGFPWEVSKYAPVIAKALNYDKSGKFNKLFLDGDISAYGDDHSSADMALLDILAYWTHANPKAMCDIFTYSKLGERDKWLNREDYRERSIIKAIRFYYENQRKAWDELKAKGV